MDSTGARCWCCRNDDDVYETMLRLCDVSRFSMTVMFMSSQDKQGTLTACSCSISAAVESSACLWLAVSCAGTAFLNDVPCGTVTVQVLVAVKGVLLLKPFADRS